MRYAKRPLQEGARVRLREDGPALTVERVTAAAAYVRSERRRQVVIPAKVDGEGAVLEPEREFEGREGGLLAISPNAFVFAVEGEEQ